MKIIDDKGEVILDTEKCPLCKTDLMVTNLERKTLYQCSKCGFLAVSSSSPGQ